MDYNNREHISLSSSTTSFLSKGFAPQQLSFSVICVDDEPSLLATIKLFLERKGIFTVDTTTNAKDALTKIKLHKYDVVVSDYQMPEMDGIQFLKELREDGNTIPFIIFTGKGHENVVIEAYNAGAEFYLQKGGDSKAMLLDLMNKIKQVVTHRRTEEALLENEERYRKVVEQSHDVIYIFQGTKFIFVNDRATEITGYSKIELYEMNFRDLVHPDDQEYVIEIARDGAKGENASQTYEIRIVTKTGDVRYLDLAVSSLTYKGENAVLGSARDITERKRAEDELRKSEEKYRSIFNTFDDLYYQTDIQGIINNLSPSCKKITGWDPSELIGLSVLDLYPFPEQRGKLLDEIFKNGAVNDYEILLRNKEGEHLNVSVTSHLVRDGQGNPLGIEGTLRNITERKQMEDAIRTTKQQLHAIIDGSSIPMFVISNDHKILYWNKALEFYTGLKATDMIGTGRHWSAFYPMERPCMADLLVDDDHYRIPTLYKGKYKESRLLDGAYEAIDFFPHIGGEEGTWMLFTAVAIKDENGNMIGALETLQDISIQKQIEEALRTSEQQYRSVVEDQTEFICRFRPDGTLTFVNDAYCRYFGLNKDECIGKKHEVSLYPEDIHIMNMHLAALTPGNPNTIIEHRIIMPSGEVRWQRWSDRAIFDGTGRVLEYQSVGRDTTEQREGEENLRNSEKYLKTIFDSVQTGLVIINPTTHTIHDTNPAAVKLIGTDINNIIGKSCHNFICPAETGKCPITDLKKKIENAERILLTADGRRIPILKTVIPAIFSGNQYLLESFLDITDRKRAEDAQQNAYAELENKVAERTAKLSMLTRDLQMEIAERNRVMEALQVSERKYRGLVEQTSDIVFQIDPRGIISYCSPNVQTILNYTPEETVGRPLVEFMTPAEAERFVRIHNQNISLKRSVTDLELTILDKINNPHIFEVSGNPVHDRTGKLNGFSGIARDITERKRMQEEIAASLMEKETMIKEIHHRVKNNMQVISSLLNLQAKLIKDEKSREVIRESQNRVRSIALVHEKLYQSKNLSRINFQDYLLKMADYLFQSYGINPNSIRLEIDAKNIFLPIDKAIPISLIVNELLSNSLKYAFPDKLGGTISITMRSDGQTYILNVRDDGIGLPVGIDLNHSDTLGLQLVNSLVEQIQGTIELKREKGTRFEIIFMIEQKEGEHNE